MAYIATSGLGAWWDPRTWGGGDEVDPRALAAAGDVRYRKQLCMWTRQVRLWINARMGIARDAGDTAAMRIYAERLGKLLDLENQLEPGMKTIDEAQRKADPSWRRPTDFGYFYQWTGWNGTATQPPTLPPEATALSDEQAKLDGESSNLYKVGVAVLVFGVVGLATGGLSFIAGAIIVGLAGMMIVADRAIESPAGQDAIKKFGANFGANFGAWLPIAAGAVALLLLVQGKSSATSGRSRRK